MTSYFGDPAGFPYSGNYLPDSQSAEQTNYLTPFKQNSVFSTDKLSKESSKTKTQDLSRQKITVDLLKAVTQLDNPSQITELNLDGNPGHLEYKLKSISGLHNLMNLRVLNLSHNDIQRIENLNHLKNLETLNLSFNKISKLEGLSALKSLEILNLANNLIGEIPPLIAKNTSLTHLDLSNNFICDKASIMNLRALGRLAGLNLSNNPVCEMEGYSGFVLQTLKKLLVFDRKENPNESKFSNKSGQLSPMHIQQQGMAGSVSVPVKKVVAQFDNIMIDECTSQLFQYKDVLKVPLIGQGHQLSFSDKSQFLNGNRRVLREIVELGDQRVLERENVNAYFQSNQEALYNKKDLQPNMVTGPQISQKRDSNFSSGFWTCSQQLSDQFSSVNEFWGQTNRLSGNFKSKLGLEGLEKNSIERNTVQRKSGDINEGIETLKLEISQRAKTYQRSCQSVNNQKEVIMESVATLDTCLRNVLLARLKISLPENKENSILLNERSKLLLYIKDFLDLVDSQTQHQASYSKVWNQINEKLGAQSAKQGGSIAIEDALDKLSKNPNRVLDQLRNKSVDITNTRDKIRELSFNRMKDNFGRNPSHEAIFDPRWESLHEEYHGLLEDIFNRAKIFTDLNNLYINLSQLMKIKIECEERESLGGPLQAKDSNALENFVYESPKHLKNLLKKDKNNSKGNSKAGNKYKQEAKENWNPNMGQENNNRKEKINQHFQSLKVSEEQSKRVLGERQDIINSQPKEVTPTKYGIPEQGFTEAKSAANINLYGTKSKKGKSPINEKENMKEALSSYKKREEPATPQNNKVCESCIAKDNIVKVTHEEMIKAHKEKIASDLNVVRLQSELKKIEKEAKIRHNDFEKIQEGQTKEKEQFANALALLSEICAGNLSKLDDIWLKIVSSVDKAKISSESSYKWLVSMQTATIEDLLKANRELQQKVGIFISNFEAFLQEYFAKEPSYDKGDKNSSDKSSDVYGRRSSGAADEEDYGNKMDHDFMGHKESGKQHDSVLDYVQMEFQSPSRTEGLVSACKSQKDFSNFLKLKKEIFTPIHTDNKPKSKASFTPVETGNKPKSKSKFKPMSKDIPSNTVEREEEERPEGENNNEEDYDKESSGMNNQHEDCVQIADTDQEDCMQRINTEGLKSISQRKDIPSPYKASIESLIPNSRYRTQVSESDHGEYDGESNEKQDKDEEDEDEEEEEEDKEEGEGEDEEEEQEQEQEEEEDEEEDGYEDNHENHNVNEREDEDEDEEYYQKDDFSENQLSFHNSDIQKLGDNSTPVVTKTLFTHNSESSKEANKKDLEAHNNVFKAGGCHRSSESASYREDNPYKFKILSANCSPNQFHRTSQFSKTNSALLSNLQENIAQHIRKSERKEAQKHLKKVSRNIYQYKSIREKASERSRRANRPALKSPPSSNMEKVYSIPMLSSRRLTVNDATSNTPDEYRRSSVKENVSKQRTNFDYSKVFKKSVPYPIVQERDMNNISKLRLDEKKKVLERPGAANYNERFDLESPHHPIYSNNRTRGFQSVKNQSNIKK